MTLQTNKGPKEIKLKDLDFTNVMCDLEDNGVDVMALLDDEKRNEMKMFGTMRAIVKVLVRAKDMQTAGKVFSEHLKNGGSMDAIMDAFTEVMSSAGFGEAAETETPQ